MWSIHLKCLTRILTSLYIISILSWLTNPMLLCNLMEEINEWMNEWMNQISPVHKLWTYSSNTHINALSWSVQQNSYTTDYLIYSPNSTNCRVSAQNVVTFTFSVLRFQLAEYKKMDWLLLGFIRKVLITVLYSDSQSSFLSLFTLYNYRSKWELYTLNMNPKGCLLIPIVYNKDWSTNFMNTSCSSNDQISICNVPKQ